MVGVWCECDNYAGSYESILWCALVICCMADLCLDYDFKMLGIKPPWKSRRWLEENKHGLLVSEVTLALKLQEKMKTWRNKVEIMIRTSD